MNFLNNENLESVEQRPAPIFECLSPAEMLNG